jgi:hypothetical protein
MLSAALILDVAYFHFLCKKLAPHVGGQARLMYAIGAIQELAGLRIHLDYRYGFTATKDGLGNAFTTAIGYAENGGIKCKICGALKLTDGKYKQPHSVDIAISKSIDDALTKVAQGKVDKVILIAGDRDFSEAIEAGGGDVNVLASDNLTASLEAYRLLTPEGKAIKLDDVIRRACKMQQEAGEAVLPPKGIAPVSSFYRN